MIAVKAIRIRAMDMHNEAVRFESRYVKEPRVFRGIRSQTWPRGVVVLEYGGENAEMEVSANSAISCRSAYHCQY
jgi:hypothetical protein